MSDSLPLRLSVVLPAYNELQRLPRYLLQIREYCDQQHPQAYEVVVVDDGSHDGMWEWLQGQQQEWSELRLLRHSTNLGKGAAVRTGVESAFGECVLFADADGATPISEESELRALLQNGYDLAVGNRVGSGAHAERHWFRSIQAWVFRQLVRALVRLQVRDSQCGFKMLTRRTALELFPRLRENGFLLDIELLLAAQDAHCVVGERAVRWREIEGSKVRPVRDIWRMVTGLWQLRKNRRPVRDGSRASGCQGMAQGIDMACEIERTPIP